LVWTTVVFGSYGGDNPILSQQVHLVTTNGGKRFWWD
jgi:hypothetical protein